MNITATFFHGTAGWIVAVLAISGAGSILSGTWDWARERYGPGRRVRIGWAVTLPGKTRGIVAAYFPAVYDQPARVLLEQMSGPGGEHSGDGSCPQAAIVLAFDCTRVPRKGFLYVCRSLRQAIREFPSTGKDA
jgi:hypothetical protein